MLHFFSGRKGCIMSILRWFASLDSETDNFCLKGLEVSNCYLCVYEWFYSTIPWHKAALSLKLKNDSVILSFQKNSVNKYLRIFEMSNFKLDTGHITSVIYITCILFSEISVHVTLLDYLNLLSSLSKQVRQISKTDLPHFLISGPKWPQFAQSPESRVLLNPQALDVGISGEARLLQNLLGKTTAQIVSVWECKYICFLVSWRVRHLDLGHSLENRWHIKCPGLKNIWSVGKFSFLPIHHDSTLWVLIKF